MSPVEKDYERGKRKNGWKCEKGTKLKDNWRMENNGK
jgi:hypothetical protein